MTKALITLHDFPKSEFNDSITTATFLKSINGYKGVEMASVFYRFFDEINSDDNGLIANMICANRSNLKLQSFRTHALNSCLSDYHYHLNLTTMHLVVNCKSEGGILQQVSYDGRIDAFVNCYLGQSRCTLLSSNPHKVLTANVLMRELGDVLEELRGHKKLAQDSFAKLCDKAESFCVAISSLDLTPKEKQFLGPFIELAAIYADFNNTHSLKESGKCKLIVGH
ncbi:hypothetical protein [Vibrio crassostreae]|uniref:hypothetical protein n=1 Tax=Vibrio crassostreae TaxID=246167 RepID=UPI000630C7FD|nr:hypothetical protein [Vibrio crassostreae]CDT76806.1 hypothetical protein VCRLGP8_990061 [Vibrio crassostreae]